jgi:hypothetical protein
MPCDIAFLYENHLCLVRQVLDGPANPGQATLFRNCEVKPDRLAFSSNRFDSGFFGTPVRCLMSHVIIGGFAETLEKSFCSFGHQWW